MDTQSKTILQVVDGQGNASGAAMSAPDWFIHDGESPSRPEKGAEDRIPPWGKAFSQPKGGNDVDFYVTGDEYYASVARAITGAKKSVMITGWQVNFDVDMPNGKTLWECLKVAVDAGAKVYVMPWLSPKIPVVGVGMDLGDFETMLAVAQLNAGRAAPSAFCMPALSQSDIGGLLGIGFSHHQKSVIVDGEHAYVGGLDLAYGRRDDAKFDLKAGWRKGAEIYNPCVPHIHAMTGVEMSQYVNRGELLAGAFQGATAWTAQFLLSPMAKPIAHVTDRLGSITDAGRDLLHQAGEAWDSLNVFPEFRRRVRGEVLDAAQDASAVVTDRVSEELKAQVQRLYASGAANAADVGSAVIAWIQGAPLDQLPVALYQNVVSTLMSINTIIANELSKSSHRRTEPYDRLVKFRKLQPAGAQTLDPDVQPRMPWHDVHCSIKGPSVADVEQNFIRRWNGVAKRYENDHKRIIDPIVSAVLTGLGISHDSRPPQLPRVPVPAAAAAGAASKPGTCWVQAVRSAPKKLLRDEAAGRGQTLAADEPAQNNCLKAVFAAIRGSQNFIYIENQFFQSDFGDDFSASAPSGPHGTLTDIRASKSYQEFARELGIEGVPIHEVPGRIRWRAVADIMEKRGGPEFMNDIKRIINNSVAIHGSQAAGKAQARLLNPIGDALAWRVRRAIIADKLPFHIYMVLPAHPEGTLDTINIMAQLHLTMQSLVFGTHSLVNQIRRALLEQQYLEQGVAAAEAKTRSRDATIGEVIQAVGDGWKKYLTLLNLRSWSTIGGRPVTEQIYVHSKLFIVDDRVAVIGSNNINDRSTWGDRDSELALIIKDDSEVSVALDGTTAVKVSAKVHDFRVRLWKKLFGITGNVSPASSLAGLVNQPAAQATWEAIQQVAERNATAYSRAFAYLPRSDSLVKAGQPASSIWPTWKDDRLGAQMPFNELFWRDKSVREEPGFSWDSSVRPHESAPAGVQGFIVALPTTWTEDENNRPPMNLTLLANIEKPAPVLQSIMGSDADSREVAA